jgi:hypothetical protein
VALDLAYHVAAGLDWMSRKIHPGIVLYLAYEGLGGLRKRAKALRQKYGVKDVPLYVAGAAYDLRAKPGRQALGALIADLPSKPVFIIIDTLARALSVSGGDENSSQDVGSFNAGVAALIESTGACVMLIHHPGKQNKGARGSSALIGALDTEFEIENGQMRTCKQREMELSLPVAFKLAPVLVGLDADGEEETSCVVEQAARASGTERISGNAKRGFEVLCQMSANNTPVQLNDWRDECKEFLGAKAIAQRFYDIKKALLIKGYIVVDGGCATRKMT